MKKWFGHSRSVPLPKIIVRTRPCFLFWLLQKNSMDFLKDLRTSFTVDVRFKPLSHQGGVLTVIPRRPKKCRTPRCAQYERMHHHSNAVASPLDAVGSHRTPSDGAHFEHTQNKHRHSAFAGRPNRAQRGHRKVTIAAQ